MHRVGLGIQLEHDRPRHAEKNSFDREAIVSPGIIAVLRYSQVACRDQVSELLPQGRHNIPDGS